MNKKEGPIKAKYLLEYFKTSGFQSYINLKKISFGNLKELISNFGFEITVVIAYSSLIEFARISIYSRRLKRFYLARNS